MNVEGLQTYRETGVSSYYLLDQYQQLEANQKGLRGLYVLPSKKDVHVWYGLLYVYSGIFSDTMYHLAIVFQRSCTSTDSVPSVYFRSKTFHPLIDTATGRFDLSVFLKSSPSPAVFELLHYVLQSFYSIPTNTMNPLNKEAYMLFRNPEREKELRESCRKLAREISKKFSIDDPGSPFFVRIDNENEFRRFRQALLGGEI